LKFGLSGCAGGFDSSSPQEILEMSSLAEELGFSGIWINEEHFQQGGRPRKCYSPLILGAAIASRTTKIRIGFSVLLMSLHNPVRLAEDVASIDLISGGRLDFGISRGNSEKYLQGFGIDKSRASVENFREAIDFLARLWQGNEFGQREKKFQINKTIQQPHPPIFVGTYSEEIAHWAASKGYSLIQHGIQSKANVKKLLQSFEKGGGDLTKVPVGRFVYVGKDDTSAREVAWPASCELAAFLRKSGMHKKGILTEEDLDPERFYHEMVIAGGPDTCLDQLKSLSNELGINYVNSLPSFFGYLTHPQILSSTVLFSKSIMPHFNSRSI
jgi:alkanesulfonate monooxygenase SsuD/methylene tetrahydromethanopterin reductase-like flavin-dependent oxidoreductase (luciferase family)